MARQTNIFKNLRIIEDEDSNDVNMDRKATKKLREIESLKNKEKKDLTDSEKEKISKEQYWKDILDPVKESIKESIKETKKRLKKEKEKERVLARRGVQWGPFPTAASADAVAARAAAECALLWRGATAAEQLMLQSQLLREIGPDTEFTGDLLRRVRESQGIEVGELSARTKITKQHIRAIEEEQFHELPPAVYIRGFVGELAKLLKLDVTQVTRTYMKRVRPPSGSARG